MVLYKRKKRIRLVYQLNSYPNVVKTFSIIDLHIKMTQVFLNARFFSLFIFIFKSLRVKEEACIDWLVFLAAPEQEGNGSVGNNTGGRHNSVTAQIIGKYDGKISIDSDKPNAT